MLQNSNHAPAPKSHVQELGQRLVEQLHRATDKTYVHQAEATDDGHPHNSKEHDLIIPCSGRSIASQFLTLPPRAEIPDYYDFTKLPVAIDMIEKKLQRNAYPTMTTLESDFKRMVQNAKDYNAPKSDIYEDAERIRKLVYNYMKINNPQYTEDPNYTSFPTPISRTNGVPAENGMREDEDVKEAPASREASERAKRAIAPKTSEPRSDRKVSMAPSGGTTGDDEEEGATGGDLDFTGMSFQEAQQKIISHLLRYTDDE